MALPSNPSEVLPWLFSGTRLVIVLTLLFVGIGLYLYSRTDALTDEQFNNAVNIGVQEGKNAIITNQIVNQNGVVKNAEIVTNGAKANLAHSVNRDSATFDGSEATDRFCQRFCRDGSCAEWRKTHVCN